ncbi:MAG: bifunctional demethylmenaquinone methyltransferase/2-methoxy-6-polyprenyl-1,4-benzoquinol methylase UbiE [Acidobacteriaceae bacterium]|nr:bifunctional demethylmenaquinone methyltransferase/2-methoxy-6-polyprenyl-1,4-benzoquinol methylase UbiE [Acidobacteriaceae bacterium]
MGTTPPGTTSEQQAAHWVREMFAGIAPRYDLANHILSFNIDRRWRKLLIRHLEPSLRQPDARVLDLCCGTGDVLLDLHSIARGGVIGADFCHPMLISAQEKAAQRGIRASLVEADALGLPLADGALDAIAISFGFRNLANYTAGLRELHRVLKAGGLLAILEFSHPRRLFMKAVYGLYSRVLLPLAGGAISGSREAYSYLPDSIRKFPAPEELRRMMEAGGFMQTSYELLTGGIAALHIGLKSPPRRTAE